MLGKNNIYLIALVVIMSALYLSACSGNNEATVVHDNIKKLKEKIIKNKTKPMPFSIAPPAPTSYQGSNLRSPFENTQNLATNKNVDKPLMLYPVNMLKFVGTVLKENKQFAYVLTPDNKIYQVTLGDLIGDHKGKIINITSGRMEVLEQNSEQGKPIKQRVIVLQLKEENK